MKAFIVAQLTHLRPFLTADILTCESSTSVTNNNNGDGTEVLPLARGQTIMSLSLKKKGENGETKEDKHPAQTEMISH